MIVLAVGAGTAAAFGADRYLASLTATHEERTEPVERQIAFRTIVAAGQPLRFGTELSASNLSEIPWPDESVPNGAFSTIDEVMQSGRRVVLSAIETNEPILRAKITGPNGRAGLANIIADGMRAATVRVNDVAGVAGFILPGDRVDVVWTRDSDDQKSVASVIEQNIKVLTIDQLADERAEDPRVVQAVTLEVSAVGAQRLTLASTAGTLSLVLRRAGDIAGLSVSSVSTLDLDTTRVAIQYGVQCGRRTGLAHNPFSSIWVTHAETRLQHSVPSVRGRAVGTHSANGGPSGRPSDAVWPAGTELTRKSGRADDGYRSQGECDNDTERIT